MQSRIADILLVEDDTLDVKNAQRTLEKIGVLNVMHVAKNGEEAIEYLEQRSVKNEPYPDFVLLDLNMPKMNGIEFLQAIRKHEKWRDLKVFVLTTSEEVEEKTAAKKLGVSGYITKPLRLNNPSSIDSFNLMIDLLNIKKQI
jgi:CheY-like chemotaxis protein